MPASNIQLHGMQNRWQGRTGWPPSWTGTKPCPSEDLKPPACPAPLASKKPMWPPFSPTVITVIILTQSTFADTDLLINKIKQFKFILIITIHLTQSSLYICNRLLARKFLHVLTKNYNILSNSRLFYNVAFVLPVCYFHYDWPKPSHICMI